MRCKLVIPAKLPGLNEYVSAERANPFKAAKLKKDTETFICYCIKQQLRGVRFEKPVKIAFLWFEKNRRRDKDNIAFAKKFVQDALVNSGVLANDGWKEIAGFKDEFFVDSENVRVEVIIRELGE